MKNLSLLFSLIYLTACQTGAKQTLVGNDRDPQGCISSAGYTWSKLRKECIQVFNEGLRLNPIDQDSTQAIFSAFILSNADSTLAELFVESDSYLIERIDKNHFGNEIYQFNISNKILKIKGEDKYKAED